MLQNAMNVCMYVCMEWNGMEWNGVEWNGMVWYGMVCMYVYEYTYKDRWITLEKQWLSKGSAPK